MVIKYKKNKMQSSFKERMNPQSTGYAEVKGQVLDGEQLWVLIEGLEANDLLHYTHLLTGLTFSSSHKFY